MFPHRNTHKYSWTSPDGKTHKQMDHILIDRRQQSITILNVRSFRAANCDTDYYRMVGKVRERLAVSKHELDEQTFNFMKLMSCTLGTEMTNRFAALGNLVMAKT
jgi:hypothetical protein